MDAAEVFQVNLPQWNLNAKLLLQLEEQFDQLERVKDASSEEVKVMRRHFDVQVLREDLRNIVRECLWISHSFPFPANLNKSKFAAPTPDVQLSAPFSS